jgi:hypothetical protein
MDFQSVDSAPATQVIELKADDVKGDKLVPLRYNPIFCLSSLFAPSRLAQLNTVCSLGNVSPFWHARFVKFQNVSSITIFVESNQGGEPTTVIQRLRFIGQAQSATNMNEFKRVRTHHRHRHFSLPATRPRTTEHLPSPLFWH